jgi:hypothetical protein
MRGGPHTRVLVATLFVATACTSGAGDPTTTANTDPPPSTTTTTPTSATTEAPVSNESAYLILHNGQIAALILILISDRY